MTDYVHEFTHTVPRGDGNEYRIRAVAEPRGNIWIGWLEFASAQDGSVLRTGEETSQPTRDGVGYWASGLEPIYLEGALKRAL
jgi:hypothetical protein